MQVVDLGEVKRLLQRWDAVRQLIVKGDIKAFALCLRDNTDTEAIFLAGLYEREAKERLKASMKMSWELTKAGDFRASQ